VEQDQLGASWKRKKKLRKRVLMARCGRGAKARWRWSGGIHLAEQGGEKKDVNGEGGEKTDERFSKK